MITVKAKPQAKQLEFLSWEFGAFFHFGIRTFFRGHDDWDGKEMPLSAFNPPDLDCRSWIRTVKEAGATYAVLTAKHHDGFANWPSRYTDYNVAHTPWKDGKGDVVADYVAACREYGLKVGLYYSPADASFLEKKPSHREYDDYFINQIGELLQNYGKIDYLWFDGCGSEGHQYDIPRIIHAIRSMQPDILIFNMWDPDTRWIGNEAGIAPSPNHNTVEWLDFSIRTEEKEKLSGARFLPGECDCRMRYRTWFASEDDAHTVKSVDELMGLYDYSVGRGANLLLNIGPAADGHLAEPDATRLLEFGQALRERFAHPLAVFGEMVPDGERRCVLGLQREQLVNCVVLEEDITDGEGIEEFCLYAKPIFHPHSLLVYRGYTVGHKAICRFPSIFTQQITVEIVRQNGDCRLARVAVYHRDEY